MITVAILTVSDSAVAGTRVDTSGPALQQKCVDLGWTVTDLKVVPDDEPLIAAQLAEWADSNSAALILTTGGTGVALRDITPEATRNILEREIPGIPELMRVRGLEQTKFSVLSRAVAGTRKRSVIVNLPGSPLGAIHSLNSIAHLVPHLVDLLAGRTQHPANATLNVVKETHPNAETS